MGLVDRINHWLLSRLRRNCSSGNVSSQVEALIIRQTDRVEVCIPWRDISRIVILTENAYIPSDFRTMRIEWGERQMITINEDMKGWDSLPTAFDRFLAGAIPSTQWLLELQTAHHLPFTVYEKRIVPNG
jgi:hypothetical protein